MFCLHAIHTGEWTDRTVGEEELLAFKKYIDLPPTMDAFGTHVWIIRNGDEFLARVRAACRRLGISGRSDLVSYVDEGTTHGRVPPHLIGFTKMRRFAPEREYRLIFDSSEPLEDPFEIDVGSLEDISMIVALDEFRNAVDFAFQRDDGVKVTLSSALSDQSPPTDG